MLWKVLNSRNPKSIEVVKVKGHATKEEVEEGQTELRKEKLGVMTAPLPDVKSLEKENQLVICIIIIENC